MKHVFTLLSFALMSSGLAQVPDYIPTDGLLAWYPMNGNALDESGNGFNCQSVGATLTEDRFGIPSSAYAFDGQGSHLQGASLPFSDLSISIWFKPDAGILESYGGGTPPTGAQLIGQGTSHNPCRYCDWAIGVSDWYDGTDQLAWEKANVSSCQVQQSAATWNPEIGVWTHLVAVSEGSNVTFYINGSWVSTIPFEEPLQHGGSVFSIGARYVENCNGGGSCTGPDNAWSGAIDDVAIWDRALTPEEVESVHSSELILVGCTDTEACNYEPTATEDDGSCLAPISILNVGDTVVTTEPLILESSGTQCSWSTGAGTCSTLVTETGWYSVTQLESTSEGLRIDPGEQVSLGGEDDFNFGTGDFSIAIWFRSLDSITDYSSQLDPNGQFEILGKRPTSWTGNNNYYYDIQAGISHHASYGTNYQSAPGVKFHWNSEPHPGSFNAYTDQVVCDGSWHHLTAVKEGTTLKMALDGSFVYSAQDRTPNSNQTADNNGPLYLGVADSTYAPMAYFIGQVQIFNESLTESELESLMVAGVDPSAPGLLGAWEFRGEEASPSDLSGGGNHADLGGASFAYAPANCVSSDSVYVQFLVPGCTDSTACNFNPEAEVEDGSCLFPPQVDLGIDTVTCEDIVVLDAGEGFVSYQWNTGENTQSIEAMISGEYGVTVVGAANNSNAFVMDFDGDNDLIQTDIQASELLGLHGLSIAVRFKWMGEDSDGGPQEQGILSNARSGNSQLDFGIDFEWPEGDRRLSLAWADMSTLGSNGMQYSLLDAVAIEPGVWYDVVVTLSTNSVKWHLNGELVEQDLVVFSELGQESDEVPSLRLGKANEIYDTHFNGVLDDLQFFTRTLTSEEAEGVFSCDANLDATGLIGHWSFDEGSGVEALDASPHGNDGNVVGAQFIPAPPASVCSGCAASDTIQVTLHHGGCFCGQGTIWDETTEQCLAIDNDPLPACGDGTVWDPVEEECIIVMPSDTDFDGCVSMVDLLGLLTVFGSCIEVPWECGDPLEYQGYDYETVQIGEQCWFAENARFLPDVSPPDVGGEDDAAAHAYVSGYSGSSESEASSSQSYLDFAPLYNSQAISVWNLCPVDWHVSTDEDWNALENYLGMPEDELDQIGWRGTNEGTMLKAAFAWNGSNEFGFTAVPNGNRAESNDDWNYTSDTFYCWTPNLASGELNGRELRTSMSGIYRSVYSAWDAFSVRCVQDSE